jgi:hygromycin-B 4-O-kinase
VIAEAVARDFVARRYGRRASGMRVLGAGEWSRAYSLVLDGRDVVVRFGGHVEDFRKDAAMAAHAGAALPVPAVIEVGAAGDGYFAVSQRVRGNLLDQLDGAGMRAVLPALLAGLDAIASVDVSATRGYGIWAPSGAGLAGPQLAGNGPAATWAEALLAVSKETTRVPGWRTALAASPTGMAPFDRGQARLAELTSDLRVPRRLIHGDLLNRNVIVRQGKVAAVIDWGNALYGDPLYDAAWLIYWWPWYPQWGDIDIEAELRRHWASRGCMPADARRRLAACLLHIGLDAMSYTAFRGRWDDLARNAAQLAALA